MVGAFSAQLRLAGDLALELVDQAQARLDRAGSRLRKREPLQERAAGDAEEVGDGQGLP